MSLSLISVDSQGFQMNCSYKLSYCFKSLLIQIMETFRISSEINNKLKDHATKFIHSMVLERASGRANVRESAIDCERARKRACVRLMAHAQTSERLHKRSDGHGFHLNDPERLSVAERTGECANEQAIETIGIVPCRNSDMFGRCSMVSMKLR